jgi:hypothetical protein
MARIRTIKPEFFESQKLGSLSILARLTFTGLISLADDEGRGRAGIMFLIGRIHPYAQDVTPANLQLAIEELVSADLATIYQIAACDYYQLPGWDEHQRIEKPRPSALPAPEGYSSTPPRLLTEGSPTTPRRVAVGMEGNGMEGKRNGKGVDRTRFAPPTPEEVKAYCSERGGKVDPERWLAYYESNGWKVGRNPMKDWKAAVRTWERNGFQQPVKRIVGAAAVAPGKYDHLG